MPRVKICGITSVTEARLAITNGASAVGVLVGQRHVADDFVDIDGAAEIFESIPPFVTPVLVSHVEDPDAIVHLVEQVRCLAVQLHSDLPATALRSLRQSLRPRSVVGKVSIGDLGALDRALSIEEEVDAIVLDSIDLAAGKVGGTGKVHDWSISSAITARTRKPIILAGGLTPTNVAEAIAKVRPWAVDVNSGVESPDGKKVGLLIREFVRAASRERAPQ